VPIDARSEMPDLSTRATEHADQALRIFDHLAGNTTGEEQFEAAWRCGRSLALLGRYDDALDAFAFAHHALRGMHPSDTPPHLKPLADGLSVDRKRVAYLRDVTRYGLEYLLYRRAQEHRLPIVTTGTLAYDNNRSRSSRVRLRSRSWSPPTMASARSRFFCCSSRMRCSTVSSQIRR